MSQPATAEAADSGRPTALLPVGHLIRISLYWLGLTAIDGAVGLFIQNRLELRRHGRASAGSRSNQLPALDPDGDRLDPHPTDGRFDQRLHDQPLGTAQAVHRLRVARRPRVPVRDRDVEHRPDARRVRGAPGVQHQRRPRPVPGLRPGPHPQPPGRDGQRDGRPDADPRQRDRLRRGDRCRARWAGSSWRSWPSGSWSS